MSEPSETGVLRRDRPPRPGWWRRNAVALVALGVLAPVTAVVIGGGEWIDYFSGRPVIPVDVDDSGIVDLADAAWGPAHAEVLTKTEGLSLPPQAQVIAVVVPVDPAKKGVSCSQPVLVEQSSGRRWNETRLELGIPTSPDEPDTCLSDSAEPYSLIVPFVVPADAEGPFWVEISPSAALPRFVRFSVDP